MHTYVSGRLRTHDKREHFSIITSEVCYRSSCKYFTVWNAFHNVKVWGSFRTPPLQYSVNRNRMDGVQCAIYHEKDFVVGKLNCMCVRPCWPNIEFTAALY